MKKDREIEDGSQEKGGLSGSSGGGSQNLQCAVYADGNSMTTTS